MNKIRMICHIYAIFMYQVIIFNRKIQFLRQLNDSIKYFDLLSSISEGKRYLKRIRLGKKQCSYRKLKFSNPVYIFLT